MSTNGNDPMTQNRPTVDDAMVERAARAMCDDVHGLGPWDDMPNVARPIWRQTARAALNAALGTGDEA